MHPLHDGDTVKKHCFYDKKTINYIKYGSSVNSEHPKITIQMTETHPNPQELSPEEQCQRLKTLQAVYDNLPESVLL